jgi:hypothetical protein
MQPVCRTRKYVHQRRHVSPAALADDAASSASSFFASPAVGAPPNIPPNIEAAVEAAASTAAASAAAVAAAVAAAFDSTKESSTPPFLLSFLPPLLSAACACTSVRMALIAW